MIGESHWAVRGSQLAPKLQPTGERKIGSSLGFKSAVDSPFELPLRQTCGLV